MGGGGKASPALWEQAGRPVPIDDRNSSACERGALWERAFGLLQEMAISVQVRRARYGSEPLDRSRRWQYQRMWKGAHYGSEPLDATGDSDISAGEEGPLRE